MLKLKRVDIQGFKSFYDRTEMRFHGSGIAAVVGPNGCGKSNLSDAISWVLGEQSAKSLRGARMEDVIFAGTRERKPLGMAQVTLTMVDPEGANSVAHHRTAIRTATPTANGHMDHVKHHGEITITRRLYRSGESEYLIDGRAARLRDIQDIFIGTGLGPESYAIIEQGRIGQILSNKPADRRAIIEEAAGIGKYKTRKRLAESKLESAKQNLSRVFDILEEVGRQVNSLKRQASKAKRYEELRTEMVAHLRQAVSGRFRMLEREAAKLALDLNQATANFQRSANNVSEQGTRTHRDPQEVLLPHRSRAHRSAPTVAELNLESERTRGRLELQAKQIGSIEERLARAKPKPQELEARHRARTAELEVALESRGRNRSAKAEPARERLGDKTAERDALQARPRGARAKASKPPASRSCACWAKPPASAINWRRSTNILAAIERDAARCQQGRGERLGDLARLEGVKAELSEQALRAPARTRIPGRPPPPRRRRNEGAPGAHAAEARQKLEQLRAVLRGRKPARIRSKKSFRIAPIPPNP